MIAGSLKNLPLTDLFQLVANSQKSGELTVTRLEKRARLYFDEGRIAYAHLTPGKHLGEILVRMDRLTALEVQQILNRQKRENPDSLLGRMAVDAELITEDDLQAAIEWQAFEVVTELMSWSDGSFEFTQPKPDASQTPSGEGIDAMMLLMRVVHGLDRYKSEGVSPDVVFVRAGDPTQAELSAGAWEILGLVDGRRSARSVAAETDLSERQVFHLLEELRSAGVIEPLPYPADEPLVLAVSSSEGLQRLLRLTLQRAGMRVETISAYQETLAAIEEHHPKALVLDDDDGAAWEVVRELRRNSSHGHLPTLLLVAKQPRGSIFRPLPRADTLIKPFEELMLQQQVGRLLGRAVLGSPGKVRLTVR